MQNGTPICRQNPHVTVRQKVEIPLKGLRINANLITFSGFTDNLEHFALSFQPPAMSQDLVPVRLHSECVTGDVFGSLKCDCGEQLHESLNYLSMRGGILL